jgi:xanthine dehydrogenase YagR molybdenum-binding subunit
MPGGAARITLTRGGNAKVEVAAHEMGMGTVTVQTQVAVERLGLPIERVEFCYGDTAFPGLVLAGGLQQTASIGASVVAAHRALVTELLKLAGNDSPLAGLRPEEVGGVDGGLCKLNDPSRCESYASILGRAQRKELVVEAQAPQPLELQHWSMHSHGAMFCEVRVNAVTGETRVSRFLGSFDCGRIINAKTAASQFRGGIIMGLGLALMEEAAFDERTGRIMNPSLAEYHVPVHMDVPEIDVMWSDEPDPHAPWARAALGKLALRASARRSRTPFLMPRESEYAICRSRSTSGSKPKKTGCRSCAAGTMIPFGSAKHQRCRSCRERTRLIYPHGHTSDEDDEGTPTRACFPSSHQVSEQVCA